MATTEVLHLPRRITDLIALQERGKAVTCFPEFEILPVDFFHQKNPYKAYIFLCRFNGEIEGRSYSFRKCYARGCPQNQCSHVSLAVLIANRYLQRDYQRLGRAGIKVNEFLFTLEEMIVKFDGCNQEHDSMLTLEDCLEMAKGGDKVAVDIQLEYVPAVEHFANQKNAQTFLTADFVVTASQKQKDFQRCLACYQTDREREEKTDQVGVANARLSLLYQAFAKSTVQYNEMFFSIS